ncbi:MAG: HAD family phosphatase [Nitrospirota bacterium]
MVQLNRPLKAVLFDFDGVLADTEPLHFRMFQRVLADSGLTLTAPDYAARYLGLTDEACFVAVYAAQGLSVSEELLAQLVRRKTELMQDALRADPGIMPGVTEFARKLSGRYRLAVVSGALREEIRLCLEQAGLLEAFEHITAAQDVKNGKPAPEPYLHALRRLARTAPLIGSECFAIEDSLHGIRAARAAGMRCLAVATTYAPQDLHAADAVVSSLEACEFASLVRRLWG